MSTKHHLLRERTCKTCPFRGGFHLRHGRRVSIHQSLMVEDKSFSCHGESYDQEGEERYDARQCAGATTMLLRADHWNQVMRWSHTLGDSPTEDPEVPFTDWASWINEPVFSQDRRPPRTGCCGGECGGHTCEVVGEDCECPAGYMGAGGVVRSEDRLSDPEFCTACGSAMCPPCTSAETDEGLPLCIHCAWEED